MEAVQRMLDVQSHRTGIAAMLYPQPNGLVRVILYDASMEEDNEGITHYTKDVESTHQLVAEHVKFRSLAESEKLEREIRHLMA